MLDNHVAALVAVLLVILFGLVSLARLPIQLTPEVERPTITITTSWRAAAPEEVEEGTLSHFVLGLAGDVLREGLSFGVSGDTPGVRVRLVEDDVRARLRALQRREYSDDRVLYESVELTSRKSSSSISRTLDQLERLWRARAKGAANKPSDHS